ncbi:MAG: 3-hydroxybutyryl-CoA dehydrogenase, partial [Chloroflexi bacterium]|nr:3-hydroxybutyryl-CoA dehydrogenase [Chloroflexota bacterium]
MSRKVLVCGVGLMGHGIAQSMAAAGQSVRIYEPDRSRAEAGLERIAGNLERAVTKGKLSAEEREAVLAR